MCEDISGAKMMTREDDDDDGGGGGGGAKSNFGDAMMMTMAAEL